MRRGPRFQTFHIGDGSFAAIVGMFLALAVLKWGNPVIMDARVGWPASFAEWRVGPWPVVLGYTFFGVIALLSAAWFRIGECIPRWLVGLPVGWFALQLVSALFSDRPSTSWPLIPHFGICLGLFLIGAFSVGNIASMKPLWLALAGGLFVVAVIGWQQHFIGLGETRRLVYSLPNWRELPPEFLKKLESDRIYSTLVYPNALAGALLLLSPVALAFIVQQNHARFWKWSLVAILVVLSGACLVWSGSKSGWLIALVQIGVCLTAGTIPPRSKVLVVLLVVLAGLGGFFARYGDYFDRGATSVSARLDYWRACWITIKNSPILGFGPGTFPVYYKTLKTPESEMTRLAHNDYLQQASDSGVIAGVAFIGFWIGAVCFLYRNRFRSVLHFGVFCGVFGFALQSFVEFGLYIPGIAWIAWFLSGWGISGGNRVDKVVRPS